MARRKKQPSEQVAPDEVQPGEVYAIDGIRFRCVGVPRSGPDSAYVYIPSRKFGLRQVRPVGKDEKVDVFRS